MDYIKKFIVLKEVTRGFSANGQPVSGMVRAEEYRNETQANLSLINFAGVSDGEFYAAFFFADGNKFFLPLGATPYSRGAEFPARCRSGMACLIAFAKERAVPVLFGAAQTGYTVDDLLEYIDEKLVKSAAAAKKEPEETQKEPPQVYDDLAVATENYYLSEDADMGELAIKGEEDEQNVSEPAFAADAGGEEESFGEEETPTLRDDETNAAFGKSCESGYYLKVKDELDRIFSENPEEDCLKSTVPESRWVKIDYGGGYYLVGLVEEKGKPKYICYGVPATYAPAPPKELAGHCTFIPLSIFEMKGDGFWMLFQDAETGECLRF